MTISRSRLELAIEIANKLKRSGMGDIHGGTVAYLLYGRVSKINARCWRIARILRAQGYERWSSLAVQEAWRLAKLDDSALAAEDPQKDQPAARGNERFDQLRAFGELLRAKAHSAPPRR